MQPPGLLLIAAAYGPAASVTVSSTVLGGLLLLGGVAKFVQPREFLGSSTGEVVARLHRGIATALLIGTGEVALASALLAVPQVLAVQIAAAVGLCVATGTAAVARGIEEGNREPLKPCGCMGSLSSSSSSTTRLFAIGRPAFLTGTCLINILVLSSTHRAVFDKAWIGVAIVTSAGALYLYRTELGALLAILGSRRANVLCRFLSVARPRRRGSVIRRLQANKIWEDVKQHSIGDEPVDVWRFGCLQYVAFELKPPNAHLLLVVAMSLIADDSISIVVREGTYAVVDAARETRGTETFGDVGSLVDSS